MSCLIIEDFGTHGLRGDTEHWEPKDVSGNSFYLFFRALGRSGKANEARGRWGVGKFVFPMASRAHAMWGLTIPSDTGSPLLMGRTVFATHTIGHISFHPDGAWGVRRSPGSNFVSPVNDVSVTAHFARLFGLRRESEPGLSVVVPWVTEEVSRTELVNAVIGEYFLPLLRGELIVTVEDVEGEERLDASSVPRYESRVTSPELRARLKLGQLIVGGGSEHAVWPQHFTYAETEWVTDDRHLPDLERLRNVLEAGDAISVRLKTTVRRKESVIGDESELAIHLLRRDDLSHSRPLIIREGICVSADKTKSIAGHVALVTADDGPLATMIGDAETPAHMELQQANLKTKYVYPLKSLRFVREAAWNLLRAIVAGDSEDDPLLLADFFPVQVDEGKPGPKPVPDKPGAVVAPPSDIPDRPRQFHITRFDGGFKVSNNPKSPQRPDAIMARVAYDVRRGDPFKRYRRYDFDLADPSIGVRSFGCAVTVDGNELRAVIEQDSFGIEVKGFDLNRDLVVRVTAARNDA
jgi:hypothetical protein